jgi:hypothetical protein
MKLERIRGAILRGRMRTRNDETGARGRGSPRPEKAPARGVNAAGRADRIRAV